MKRPLGVNVLAAARQRIAWAFDTFPRVCVSFSGGKDSTVMLHLVMDEAIRRGRTAGLLFVDLEGQYQATIEHVERCYRLYAEHIDPHWVAMPIHLRNAVSQFESHWICWDPAREKDWIRRPSPLSVMDTDRYPFFEHAMEFEEFVPEFGWWYACGEKCASFVGIRADESLNRYRTVANHGKECYGGRRWTTHTGRGVYNVYPLYDWRTEDLWTYHARFPDRPHNRLYDLMHKAGLTIHQMRICQPYGDDQRKGLWLFHLLEPDTWARVVARVNGANAGALYAQEAGNVLGRIKITKPEGHTWRSFACMLLESMPPRTREHFEIKIEVFLSWWFRRGYQSIDGIPDEADPTLEAEKKVPSWRRICKALLRNDYWCKGLSFSQTKSAAYQRYLDCKRRAAEEREELWKIILRGSARTCVAPSRRSNGRSKSKR